MRLIDADALEHEFMSNMHYLTKDLVMDAAYMVNKAPTIDAVPVVRCEDCKNYRLFKNRFGVEISRCMLIGADVANEAFCSYGEKRCDDAI